MGKYLKVVYPFNPTTSWSLDNCFLPEEIQDEQYRKMSEDPQYVLSIAQQQYHWFKLWPHALKRERSLIWEIASFILIFIRLQKNDLLKKMNIITSLAQMLTLFTLGFTWIAYIIFWKNTITSWVNKLLFNIVFGYIVYQEKRERLFHWKSIWINFCTRGCYLTRQLW